MLGQILASDRIKLWGVRKGHAGLGFEETNEMSQRVS